MEIPELGALVRGGGNVIKSYFRIHNKHPPCVVPLFQKFWNLQEWSYFEEAEGISYNYITTNVKSFLAQRVYLSSHKWFKYH